MIRNYLKEIKFLKPYFVAVVAVIVISYSLYLFLSDSTLQTLGHEDGFFEWMTAVLFLTACVLFFRVFLRTKNIFLLGLALIFFVGAGEEISWGQRLLGFATPESVDKVNVQGEFNLHNLEMFNSEYLSGEKKTGFQRILEINMLFRIFSMAFLIFIPLFVYHFKPKISVNKKLQMPVAPFTLGIFFLISWAVFYSMKYFFLPRGKAWGYYLSTGEVFEATASFIYFMVALYFFRRKDDAFLGKDIKHTID